MKIKKVQKSFFLLILLTIIFVYITNISAIPEKLILFQNEDYNLNLLGGIQLKETSQKNQSVIDNNTNSANNNNTNSNKFNKNNTDKISTDIIGEIKLKLTALGLIPIKDISVSVVPEKLVVPVGETMGVKLYSKGVLVVGKSIVEGLDGKDYEPYANTNIEMGDIILEIDGKKIETIEDVKESIEKANGKALSITYEKDGKEMQDKITPIKSIDGNRYKLGIWIRDGAMGIGTVSFIDLETKRFAALGHGVSDPDTKEIIKIDSGTLNRAKTVSIKQGKKDTPGEILGIVDSTSIIGKIEKNTNIGIYGTLTSEKAEEYSAQNAIKIASRNEIELGKAQVLSTLENGITETFEIEIQKKFLDKENTPKCMIIKVTDPKLLAKTGGIIQGMSGSPILQNGKLIGAITHVFVSDPTRGYAVFADSMLQELYALGDVL